MNKKGFSTEFKVGIFVVVSIGFFIGLGIHFNQSAKEIRGKNYILIFNFLDGLQQGSPIKYSGGIVIGKVLSIEPFGDKAKLTIVVSDKIAVENTTKFSIMSNGLLGEKYVNVTLVAPEEGQTRQILPEWTEIVGQADMGLDKLLSGVTALAAEMGKVMVPLAEILGSMESNNEIPKLLSSIRGFVNNGSTLIRDNKDSVVNITKDIQNIIYKVNRGQGALGRVLNDRVMAQSLADMLDNINILVTKLSNNPLIGRK